MKTGDRAAHKTFYVEKNPLELFDKRILSKIKGISMRVESKLKLHPSFPVAIETKSPRIAAGKSVLVGSGSRKSEYEPILNFFNNRGSLASKPTQLSTSNSRREIFKDLKTTNNIHKCFAKKQLNPFEYNSQCSSGPSKGLVQGFGVCTSKGRYKQTNEDRVSIMYNISNTKDQGEIFHYFSVFDGHGGSSVSHYLRENFLDAVIKQPQFPQNISNCLKRGVSDVDERCLQQIKEGSMEPKAGSTLLTVLFTSTIIVDIGDGTYYIANVGDCRAIRSSQQGKQVSRLTRDHKPLAEQQRIQKAGGKVAR
jgi:hypothetical protein